MPDKRTRKSQPKVAALLQRALKDANMTIEELGRATGWGRNAGALIRGEVQRIAPEQARELARWLPVTQEQILVAYGFDLALSPQRQVPDEVARAWAALPERMRGGMLAVMQEAANLDRTEEGKLR